MKKLILCLVALILTTSVCFADELRLDKETQYQKKVMEVGFRILNANQIDKRMTFYYTNTKDVNAAAYGASKRICLYKGLLPFIDNDDELAAILSHEIAHGIDFHEGYLRRVAMSFRPSKYEKKADKKAVDLMVNAGYNPVAIIIILNKITGEPNFSDDFGVRTHPVGSARLAYVYEYIYAKYPAYLADNEYKNNLYYQNFLLISKKDRNLIRQKYQDKYVQVSDKKETSTEKSKKTGSKK